MVWKLIKVVKEAHTRRHRSGSGSVSARQSLNIPTKTRPAHVPGEKFAEAISSKQQDDSDVDLDFAPDKLPAHPKSIFHDDNNNNAFSFNSGSVSSPSRAAAILQQSLQMNVLQQSRAFISATSSNTSNTTFTNSSPFPIVTPQSAISRAFVKTTGRLGPRRRRNYGLIRRWRKRRSGMMVSSLYDQRMSIQEKRQSTQEKRQSTQERRQSTLEKRLSILSVSSASTHTHSTASFGSILSSRSRINPFVAQVQAQPPWRFDVVSIGDLDLSDTSSQAHGDNPPAPPASGGSAASSASVGAALRNVIQQWQVNALVDSLSDDEDNGGVEAALRRLEGQINPRKRKEKAKKVDGWVIQGRDGCGAGYSQDRLRAMARLQHPSIQIHLPWSKATLKLDPERERRPDRTTFLAEELFLDDWMLRQEVNVLDWAWYLEDRARWKAESYWSQKMSVLAAIRGRFNLLANFVVAEIVITHPNDKAMSWASLFASPSYVQDNFCTLAAITAG
ncbi:hypothetical protein BDR04DRAFT_1164642 [Suillus decipiens]|nr:hypothetical protein BDR04DRAFT_1164642 [Suillus decipiens]